MNPETRVAARRQLDKRLKPLAELDLSRPKVGWTKAVRTALGMTMAQLGRRLGVSQPRIAALEAAEIDGSITLKSLERAAEALECRVVYALVPRRPLSELVMERAELIASRRLKSVQHSMSLENQRVDRVEDDSQFTAMVRKLVETGGSALWANE